MNETLLGVTVDGYYEQVDRLCKMRLTLNVEERALWDAVYASVMGREKRNDIAQAEATQAVLTRRSVVTCEPETAGVPVSVDRFVSAYRRLRSRFGTDVYGNFGELDELCAPDVRTST